MGERDWKEEQRDVLTPLFNGRLRTTLGLGEGSKVRPSLA